jgi:hypothetical protein
MSVAWLPQFNQWRDAMPSMHLVTDRGLNDGLNGAAA